MEYDIDICAIDVIVLDAAQEIVLMLIVDELQAAQVLLVLAIMIYSS